MAASSLSGRLSGTGVYKAPENFNGVQFGYGTGLPASPLSQLDSAVEQLEPLIDRVEASVPKDDGNDAKASTRILPGFPEKITGELLFCDADNLDVSFPKSVYEPWILSISFFRPITSMLENVSDD